MRTAGERRHGDDFRVVQEIRGLLGSGYLSSSQVQPDYGLQFGFMFLAALIPVAGYLLVQNQFRVGLTAGASR